MGNIKPYRTIHSARRQDVVSRMTARRRVTSFDFEECVMSMDNKKKEVNTSITTLCNDLQKKKNVV